MNDSQTRRSPGDIAVRYRTRTEIIRDVLTACRHLGEIAMVAELTRDSLSASTAADLEAPPR